MAVSTLSHHSSLFVTLSLHSSAQHYFLPFHVITSLPCHYFQSHHNIIDFFPVHISTLWIFASLSSFSLHITYSYKLVHVSRVRNSPHFIPKSEFVLSPSLVQSSTFRSFTSLFSLIHSRQFALSFSLFITSVEIFSSSPLHQTSLANPKISSCSPAFLPFTFSSSPALHSYDNRPGRLLQAPEDRHTIKSKVLEGRATFRPGQVPALHIKPVLSSDQANYTCRVDFRIGKWWCGVAATCCTYVPSLFQSKA